MLCNLEFKKLGYNKISISNIEFDIIRDNQGDIIDLEISDELLHSQIVNIGYLFKKNNVKKLEQFKEDIKKNNLFIKEEEVEEHVDTLRLLSNIYNNRNRIIKILNNQNSLFNYIYSGSLFTPLLNEQERDELVTILNIIINGVGFSKDRNQYLHFEDDINYVLDKILYFKNVLSRIDIDSNIMSIIDLLDSGLEKYISKQYADYKYYDYYKITNDFNNTKNILLNVIPADVVKVQNKTTLQMYNFGFIHNVISLFKDTYEKVKYIIDYYITSDRLNYLIDLLNKINYKDTVNELLLYSYKTKVLTQKATFMKDEFSVMYMNSNLIELYLKNKDLNFDNIDRDLILLGLGYELSEPDRINNYSNLIDKIKQYNEYEFLKYVLTNRYNTISEQFNLIVDRIDNDIYSSISKTDLSLINNQINFIDRLSAYYHLLNSSSDEIRKSILELVKKYSDSIYLIKTNSITNEEIREVIYSMAETLNIIKSKRGDTNEDKVYLAIIDLSTLLANMRFYIENRYSISGNSTYFLKLLETLKYLYEEYSKLQSPNIEYKIGIVKELFKNNNFISSNFREDIFLDNEIIISGNLLYEFYSAITNLDYQNLNDILNNYDLSNILKVMDNLVRNISLKEQKILEKEQVNISNLKILQSLITKIKFTLSLSNTIKNALLYIYKNSSYNFDLNNLSLEEKKYIESLKDKIDLIDKSIINKLNDLNIKAETYYSSSVGLSNDEINLIIEEIDLCIKTISPEIKEIINYISDENEFIRYSGLYEINESELKEAFKILKHQLLYLDTPKDSSVDYSLIFKALNTFYHSSILKYIELDENIDKENVKTKNLYNILNSIILNGKIINNENELNTKLKTFLHEIEYLYNKLYNDKKIDKSNKTLINGFNNFLEIIINKFYNNESEFYDIYNSIKKISEFDKEAIKEAEDLLENKGNDLDNIIDICNEIRKDLEYLKDILSYIESQANTLQTELEKVNVRYNLNNTLIDSLERDRNEIDILLNTYEYHHSTEENIRDIIDKIQIYLSTYNDYLTLEEKNKYISEIVRLNNDLNIISKRLDNKNKFEDILLKTKELDNYSDEELKLLSGEIYQLHLDLSKDFIFFKDEIDYLNKLLKDIDNKLGIKETLKNIEEGSKKILFNIDNLIQSTKQLLNSNNNDIKIYNEYKTELNNNKINIRDYINNISNLENIDIGIKKNIIDKLENILLDIDNLLLEIESKIIYIEESKKTPVVIDTNVENFMYQYIESIQKRYGIYTHEYVFRGFRITNPYILYQLLLDENNITYLLNKLNISNTRFNRDKIKQILTLEGNKYISGYINEHNKYRINKYTRESNNLNFIKLFNRLIELEEYSTLKNLLDTYYIGNYERSTGILNTEIDALGNTVYTELKDIIDNTPLSIYERIINMLNSRLSEDESIDTKVIRLSYSLLKIAEEISNKIYHSLKTIDKIKFEDILSDIYYTDGYEDLVELFTGVPYSSFENDNINLTLDINGIKYEANSEIKKLVTLLVLIRTFPNISLDIGQIHSYNEENPNEYLINTLKDLPIKVEKFIENNKKIIQGLIEYSNLQKNVFEEKKYTNIFSILNIKEDERGLDSRPISEYIDKLLLPIYFILENHEQLSFMVDEYDDNLTEEENIIRGIRRILDYSIEYNRLNNRPSPGLNYSRGTIKLEYFGNRRHYLQSLNLFFQGFKEYIKLQNTSITKPVLMRQSLTRFLMNKDRPIQFNFGNDLTYEYVYNEGLGERQLLNNVHFDPLNTTKQTLLTHLLDKSKGNIKVTLRLGYSYVNLNEIIDDEDYHDLIYGHPGIFKYTLKNQFANAQIIDSFYGGISARRVAIGGIGVTQDYLYTIRFKVNELDNNGNIVTNNYIIELLREWDIDNISGRSVSRLVKQLSLIDNDGNVIDTNIDVDDVLDIEVPIIALLDNVINKETGQRYLYEIVRDSNIIEELSKYIPLIEGGQPVYIDITPIELNEDANFKNLRASYAHNKVGRAHLLNKITDKLDKDAEEEQIQDDIDYQNNLEDLIEINSSSKEYHDLIQSFIETSETKIDITDDPVKGIKEKSKEIANKRTLLRTINNINFNIPIEDPFKAVTYVNYIVQDFKVSNTANVIAGTLGLPLYVKGATGEYIIYDYESEYENKLRELVEKIKRLRREVEELFNKYYDETDEDKKGKIYREAENLRKEYLNDEKELQKLRNAFRKRDLYLKTNRLSLESDLFGIFLFNLGSDLINLNRQSISDIKEFYWTNFAYSYLSNVLRNYLVDNLIEEKNITSQDNVIIKDASINVRKLEDFVLTIKNILSDKNINNKLIALLDVINVPSDSYLRTVVNTYLKYNHSDYFFKILENRLNLINNIINNEDGYISAKTLGDIVGKHLHTYQTYKYTMLTKIINIIDKIGGKDKEIIKSEIINNTSSIVESIYGAEIGRIKKSEFVNRFKGLLNQNNRFYDTGKYLVTGSSLHKYEERFFDTKEFSIAENEEGKSRYLIENGINFIPIKSIDYRLIQDKIFKYLSGLSNIVNKEDYIALNKFIEYFVKKLIKIKDYMENNNILEMKGYSKGEKVLEGYSILINSFISKSNRNKELHSKFLSKLSDDKYILEIFDKALRDSIEVLNGEKIYEEGENFEFTDEQKLVFSLLLGVDNRVNVRTHHSGYIRFHEYNDYLQHDSFVKLIALHIYHNVFVTSGYASYYNPITDRLESAYEHKEKKPLMNVKYSLSNDEEGYYKDGKLVKEVFEYRDYQEVKHDRRKKEEEVKKEEIKEIKEIKEEEETPKERKRKTVKKKDKAEKEKEEEKKEENINKY